MTKQIILGYIISGDPDEVDSKDQIPEGLREKLYDYYLMAQKGRQKDIHKLLKAIQQYPQVPHLKNYLSSLYVSMGNTEKAYSVNKWMLKEHPDYLFGKINLGKQYLDEKKYDEIPKILGKDLELKSLYPAREVFHFQEFEAFYQITSMYFAATGDLDQYNTRLAILKQVNPDSPGIEQVENFMMRISMEKSLERMKEEESTITRADTPTQNLTGVTEAPEFENAIIQELYHHDHRIPREILDDILALPTETLIPDLHSVIEDSIQRYGYFLRRYENSEDEEAISDFLAHALFLLGELQSEESLPIVFKMLSQSTEYLRFYFGDMITEAIWEPIFRLSIEQTQKLSSFLKAPEVDTYAKSAVLDTLTQIPLHFPSKRDKIQQIFGELLNFYLQEDLDEKVFDSTFIAFLTANISELNIRELIPGIKQLYELGRVDMSISGNFKNFMKLWEEVIDFPIKRNVLSIKERYDNIVNTWAGYNEDSDPPEKSSMPDLSDIWGENYPQPVKKEPKVGRNDPCPCGSGKKYKKCCWGKE